MDWRDWPLWQKFALIVSVILIIIFLIISFILFNSSESYSSIGGVYFLLYIGLIAFLWAIGSLNKYLVSLNIKWLALIISFIIPSTITGFFVLSMGEYFFSAFLNPLFGIPIFIVIVFFLSSIFFIVLHDNK